MKVVVEPMELDDIPQVLEVDRESYTLPWPASAYRREILHNPNARYIVLRELPGDGAAPAIPEPQDPPKQSGLAFFRWPLRTPSSRVASSSHLLGYAGMWLMVDEAHITTVAVRNAWRGKGLGELLLASLVQSAGDIGARRVTLEVRVSNDVAQALYRKYGFRLAGTRRRYYSDNNEDAYIMTTGDLQEKEYRDQFDSLVEALRGRLNPGADQEVSAPAFGRPVAEEAE